ncbi:hypothetical protein E2562_003221 [Oryza meyeriana var. granulata]|uniref:DUF3615 domain-containing protein n=1 Tax=Oryza meyeriana var. granulata TaxID=110450 RepID=A0A6G1EUR5_9ORYZ|nr:hypothetical protein E2562_003221 [Oryza meyeriana var. granulata]
MLVNKEKAGYQHAPHAWRFAYRPPDYPQGATEQQPETPITDQDDNYHINIMKIALNSYNKANGNLDFQFIKGGISISNIIEFGSAYYHYNFLALSPSRDVKWFFVEVDADIQDEHGVRVCCSISLDDKEFGKCYGCENNGPAVVGWLVAVEQTKRDLKAGPVASKEAQGDGKAGPQDVAGREAGPVDGAGREVDIGDSKPGDGLGGREDGPAEPGLGCRVGNLDVIQAAVSMGPGC